MYYVLTLTNSLDLHPRHFGNRVASIVEAQLKDKVEGTCSGRHGYIIAVTKLHKPMPQGLIRNDGSGYATFHVKFDCIVFRPFKGEVMDCIVTSANKHGFFCEAGPVQIFVSSHLIPEDFTFNSTGGEYYISADGRDRIQENCEVRIRVVGTRVDANDIFCIGTMKEDFLGVIRQEG